MRFKMDTDIVCEVNGAKRYMICEMSCTNSYILRCHFVCD